jgi:hypothetical protein
MKINTPAVQIDVWLCEVQVLQEHIIQEVASILPSRSIYYGIQGMGTPPILLILWLILSIMIFYFHALCTCQVQIYFRIGFSRILIWLNCGLWHPIQLLLRATNCQPYWHGVQQHRPTVSVISACPIFLH